MKASAQTLLAASVRSSSPMKEHTLLARRAAAGSPHGERRQRAPLQLATAPPTPPRPPSRSKRRPLTPLVGSVAISARSPASSTPVPLCTSRATPPQLASPPPPVAALLADAAPSDVAQLLEEIEQAVVRGDVRQALRALGAARAAAVDESARHAADLNEIREAAGAAAKRVALLQQQKQRLQQQVVASRAAAAAAPAAAPPAAAAAPAPSAEAEAARAEAAGAAAAAEAAQADADAARSELAHVEVRVAAVHAALARVVRRWRQPPEATSALSPLLTPHASRRGGGGGGRSGGDYLASGYLASGGGGASREELVARGRRVASRMRERRASASPVRQLSSG